MFFVAVKLIRVRPVMTVRDKTSATGLKEINIKDVLDKEGHVTGNLKDAETRFQLIKDILKLPGELKVAEASIETDFTKKDGEIER
tara:strand:+ start:987 stop:1244 length:258 start_codon:yes stop_codon:yes gene_type:complete